MDDFVGSSISSPSSSSASAASSSSSSQSYPAHLESLHVTIPCKSSSDALLTSLTVALSDDLSSNVLDAFLNIFQDPAFCSKDVTFKNAQDISKHVSEQRKRVAQKRSLAVPEFLSHGRSSLYGSETRNLYGGVPHLIIDMVAQQLASEMMPMADQVDWDTIVCNTADTRCPREQDLLNMALVHRTWTPAATRALRPRVKLTGSRNLQAFLRSPRMGPWLREFYFVESLEAENSREMVRLLEYFIRNTPNLRKLAIRTWWRLGIQEPYALDSVVSELAHLRKLESLWLFTNRGHIACLPTLASVLPHLRSLKKLHLRNWMTGTQEDGTVKETLRKLISTTSSSARLTTLAFVDGGANDTTLIFLPWLLRDCPLTNLELHTKDICRLQNGDASPVFQSLRPYLSQLSTLRLHYSSLNDDKECRTEFLQSCTNLRTLSIIIGLHHELNEFPASIEYLHVHFSTIWPISGQRLFEALEPQESHTKLRTIHLTKDPIDVLLETELFGEEDQEELEAWNIDDVMQLCDQRRIELTHEFGFVSFDDLTNS
ncbi:hypothetical protein ACEPAG_5712 [Sanghuangporus baumii]